MDYNELNILLDDYIKEIKDSSEYQRLLNIYNKIKEKNQELLINYIKYKEEFIKASEYGKYYPDYNKIQKNYQEAKTRLFSLEEVKEFFNCLHQIENNINQDFLVLQEDVVTNMKKCKK